MTPHHPASLLLRALAVRGESCTAATAAHIAACPDCQAEVERLREATAALRAFAERDMARGSECLDELALAEIVDAGDAAARPEIVAHLAACPRCRRALADLLRLLADPTVAAEAARLEGAPAAAYPAGRPPAARAPRRRRFLPIGAAGALAAAAIALILLRPSPPAGAPGGREPAQYRDGSATASAAPVPLAPVGAATGRRTALRWRGVPGAERYRVVVYDQEGGVVWEAESGDTLLSLPPTVELRPGARYLWQVEARVGWDRWVGSELTAFTVR